MQVYRRKCKLYFRDFNTKNSGIAVGECIGALSASLSNVLGTLRFYPSIWSSKLLITDINANECLSFEKHNIRSAGRKQRS